MARAVDTAFGDNLVAGEFGAAQAEVITDCRAHIEAGVVVSVELGTLVLKDVLPVVGCEWANVLPLGVANPILVMNGDPAVLAD